MSPTLILGANGLLGSALLEQLSPQASGLTRNEFDLTSTRQMEAIFQHYRPRAVINAAAYTHVDQAETEPERCYAVNTQAVRSLVDLCNRWHCLLVQISTNFVFHGSADRKTPFQEEEDCNPHSIYAHSKYQAEQWARQSKKYLIVRTCGLYSHLPARGQRQHFVDRILSLAGPELRLIDDQRCTPTYVPHLAKAMEFLLTARLQGQIANGLYHLTNQGSATWYEFTQELFTVAGVTTPVEPVSTAEFAAPAARPAYSVLDVRKYRALGGPELPEWKSALQEWKTARHSSSRETVPKAA